MGMLPPLDSVGLPLLSVSRGTNRRRNSAWELNSRHNCGAIHPVFAISSLRKKPSNTILEVLEYWSLRRLHWPPSSVGMM